MMHRNLVVAWGEMEVWFVYIYIYTMHIIRSCPIEVLDVLKVFGGEILLD